MAVVLVLKFLLDLARFDDQGRTGFSLLGFAGSGKNPQAEACATKNRTNHELLLPLRICDDLGGAENGGEEFHYDAAVHNPQKHGRNA